MPRLLTFQNSSSDQDSSPAPLLLTTIYQWHELWFKVLLTDLHALHDDHGATFESIKLLRRGIELFKLFELQADIAESVAVRELAMTKSGSQRPIQRNNWQIRLGR